MEKITAYKTSDGKVFNDLTKSKEHETNLIIDKYFTSKVNLYRLGNLIQNKPKLIPEFIKDEIRRVIVENIDSYCFEIQSSNETSKPIKRQKGKVNAE